MLQGNILPKDSVKGMVHVCCMRSEYICVCVCVSALPVPDLHRWTMYKILSRPIWLTKVKLVLRIVIRFVIIIVSGLSVSLDVSLLLFFLFSELLCCGPLI